MSAYVHTNKCRFGKSAKWARHGHGLSRCTSQLFCLCLVVLMGRLSRPENEIEIHSSAPIVRLSIIFLCLFHEKPSKATVRHRQKKYVNVDFNNFCLSIYIF